METARLESLVAKSTVLDAEADAISMNLYQRHEERAFNLYSRFPELNFDVGLFEIAREEVCWWNTFEQVAKGDVFEAPIWLEMIGMPQEKKPHYVSVVSMLKPRFDRMNRQQLVDWMRKNRHYVPTYLSLTVIDEAGEFDSRQSLLERAERVWKAISKS